MISQKLLDILACPACKGALTVVNDGNGLLCPACRLKYPVRQGIPIMLLDEAENAGTQAPGEQERC